MANGEERERLWWRAVLLAWKNPTLSVPVTAGASRPHHLAALSLSRRCGERESTAAARGRMHAQKARPAQEDAVVRRVSRWLDIGACASARVAPPAVREIRSLGTAVQKGCLVRNACPNSDPMVARWSKRILDLKRLGVRLFLGPSHQHMAETSCIRTRSEELWIQKSRCDEGRRSTRAVKDSWGRFCADRL